MRVRKSGRIVLFNPVCPSLSGVDTMIDRRTFGIFLPLLALSVGKALAAGSETFTDLDATRDRLFERLAAAKDEEEGRRAESAIWRFWLDHADPLINAAMYDAMRRRDSYEWDEALAVFDRVIELAPDYAEGYNQRAFVLFLKERDEDAMVDLKRTLELEPMHFGAMAGMALILQRANKQDEAFDWLRKAIAIHPFLKERHMLPGATPDNTQRL